MISWLQGKRIDNWQQSQKQGIVLDCTGVGYEVQLLPRQLALACSVEELTLWIHHVKREDGDSLYGFTAKAERDLFRKLIAVNGVGPQIAMALLEENQVDELISAIIGEDIPTLTKAQGIGKRTAERLSIELRHTLNKLNGLRNSLTTTEDKQFQSPSIESSILLELQGTLKALGYEDIEINRAIQKVATNNPIKEHPQEQVSRANSKDFEGLLKASLIWLSNES